MKHGFFVAGLLVASSSLFADECTPRLNGYVQANQVVIEMPSASASQKAQASANVDRIEHDRKSASDCDVYNALPEIKQTNAALEAANLAVKNRGQH